MKNNKEERWNVILDGNYAISTKGRVYSNFREMILPSHKKENGYWRLCLKTGKEHRHYYVHRLVAESFLPYNGKMEVNHIDGDKANNCVGNLEWVTHGENIKHAGRMGKMFRGNGSDLTSSKLTTQQVLEIRRRYIRGSGGKLAREFGVSATTIRVIVRRQQWKHI